MFLMLQLCCIQREGMNAYVCRQIQRLGLWERPGKLTGGAHCPPKAQWISARSVLQHRTDIYKRGRKANLDPDEDQGETPPPLLTRRDPPAISANTRDGLAAECGARIYFIRSPARRPSGAKAGAPEAWPARSAARGDSLAVTGGRAASQDRKSVV